jgi:hypothetical protein
MKNSLRAVSLILLVLLVSISASTGFADDSRNSNSPFVVMEGKVTFAKARSLVLDDRSYPVSMFVRVFTGDENGPETTMQIIANTGKIDKARIYVLRGKVEKIIVLKNI